MATHSYPFAHSWLTQTWINSGSKTQAVILSTNSDRTYLRIRIRSRDEEESENDGGKANQRDIKFKIRHIAKIGSERESASEKSRNDYDPSNKLKNKSFVIKMKYPVGEFTKFKFFAQSLAERDSVLLAIKSLLEQGKYQVPRASHQTKSHPKEFEMRNHQANVKSLKALQISEQRNAIVEEDADSLTIPVPNGMTNPDDNEIFYDTRDDRSFERQGDSERDNVHVFGQSTEMRSFQRENGVGRPYNNSYKKSATSQHISNRSSKANAWMEKKTTGNHRKTATRDITDPGNYRQHQRVNHNKQRTRTQRMLEYQNNRPDDDRAELSTKEMEDHFFNDNSFACNPSQALSALEDVDIRNLAADFTNPVVGPWCTDDVCTASLKDFANSMTGIFDLKDNHNIKRVNKIQRVKAEEYISGFLGNNADMSEFLSVRDLWNAAARKYATGKELKRLHNRARNSSGKAKRLQSLRKQMTFQGADERNVSALLTISSFDDATRKAKENMDDDELLYYDSDPEDAREHTLTKGPRVVMAQRKDSRSRAKRRELLDILDTSLGMGRRWKRLGQDVLSDIIEVSNMVKHSIYTNSNELE